MPSLMHPSASEQHVTAITAEGATLPVIRAAGFEARVNAYVVGRTERTERIQRMTGTQAYTGQHGIPSAESVSSGRSPGCSGGATDLWYLSLVAPRGHGTTLRAIWANLVGTTHHAVWLEGVGMVALGHQRLGLSGPSGSGGLGYPLHWTYRQAVIPPGRDVQGVLESDLLTCYDPLLAPVASRAQRTARGNTGGRRVSAHTRPERLDHGAATLTSFTSASAGSAQEDETRAREAHPLFLLLARTGTAGDPEHVDRGSARQASERWLARLHLRYLATRISWLPYYPTWAAYLWRRALARGEAEPLAVWSYVATRIGAADYSSAIRSERMLPEEADTPAAQTAPYLAAAYLCRPDPLALTVDLSRAIAAGTFNAAHVDDATLAASLEDERAA